MSCLVLRGCAKEVFLSDHHIILRSGDADTSLEAFPVAQTSDLGTALADVPLRRHGRVLLATQSVCHSIALTEGDTGYWHVSCLTNDSANLIQPPAVDPHLLRAAHAQVIGTLNAPTSEHACLIRTSDGTFVMCSISSTAISVVCFAVTPVGPGGVRVLSQSLVPLPITITPSSSAVPVGRVSRDTTGKSDQASVLLAWLGASASGPVLCVASLVLGRDEQQPSLTSFGTVSTNLQRATAPALTAAAAAAAATASLSRPFTLVSISPSGRVVAVATAAGGVLLVDITSAELAVTHFLDARLACRDISRHGHPTLRARGSTAASSSSSSAAAAGCDVRGEVECHVLASAVIDEPCSASQADASHTRGALASVVLCLSDQVISVDTAGCAVVHHQWTAAAAAGLHGAAPHGKVGGRRHGWGQARPPHVDDIGLCGCAAVAVCDVRHEASPSLPQHTDVLVCGASAFVGRASVLRLRVPYSPVRHTGTTVLVHTRAVRCIAPLPLSARSVTSPSRDNGTPLTTHARSATPTSVMGTHQAHNDHGCGTSGDCDHDAGARRPATRPMSSREHSEGACESAAAALRSDAHEGTAGEGIGPARVGPVVYASSLSHPSTLASVSSADEGRQRAERGGMLWHSEEQGVWSDVGDGSPAEVRMGKPTTRVEGEEPQDGAGSSACAEEAAVELVEDHSEAQSGSELGEVQGDDEFGSEDGGDEQEGTPEGGTEAAGVSARVVGTLRDGAPEEEEEADDGLSWWRLPPQAAAASTPAQGGAPEASASAAVHSARALAALLGSRSRDQPQPQQRGAQAASVQAKPKRGPTLGVGTARVHDAPVTFHTSIRSSGYGQAAQLKQAKLLGRVRGSARIKAGQ